MTTPTLDLTGDVVALTTALVDTPSVSGTEGPLADAVQHALAATGRFRIDRDGDTVVARTDGGKPRRVALAGHLDTVPIADNVPSRREADTLYGCGTTDMKSGLAVLLHLAATISDPAVDLTVICYDNEEVDAAQNGLGRIARSHPEWLAADFAVLLEPTDGRIEAGCQGTVRARVSTTGRRAHSARSWLGVNAIHAMGAVLHRLAGYQPRTVTIDGCEYREGLNAVRIHGGVAGNVVPDRCDVEVNLRYAPDRSQQDAIDHLAEFFDGYKLAIVDAAPAAPPALAAVQDFVDSLGVPVQAKLGWTDVARFAEAGIPAVNFGPGDPNLAHTAGEHVDVRQITAVASVLRRYLEES